MIVGEAQSICLPGKCINVGRRNLRTKTATVAESKIVGHDDEEVGACHCHDGLFYYGGSHFELKWDPILISRRTEHSNVP